MDLSRGCFLVARSIDESDIFQNEKWLKVWIWCLSQANHSGKNVPVNIGRSKTSVWVNRGQFIFGRHKAAEKLDMKPSTVRNIMDKLENVFKNLDIIKDSHYSVVTICNYDLYQTFENYKGQEKGQPKDSRRTAEGQPKDTTITQKTPKINNTKIYAPKPENYEIPNSLFDWSAKNNISKKALEIHVEMCLNHFQDGKTKRPNWERSIMNWARTDHARINQKYPVTDKDGFVIEEDPFEDF